MGTILLFFDGVGVGRDDPGANPFAAENARFLAPVARREPAPGCTFGPIDATLGVPGLPQSATGQTTLLTGINAARLAGRHLTGIPGPSLRPVLERESLFLKLARAGKRATFANGFTREHLEARRPRWSASTRAALAGGLRLRMLDGEGGGEPALFHDWTGTWPRRRGIDVPLRTAAEAADVLVEIADGNDFTLYEYFLTDLVAHRGDTAARRREARRAEELTAAVVARAVPRGHRVVVTSDHGNLEESDHDRHTRNPVPLLVWGPGAAELCARVADLTDVTPALVAMA